MATWIPFGEIREPLRQAVFGMETPSSYEEWTAHPQCIAMCKEHYRKTRRADGYTLGYQLREGKTRAYVKEEHY